MTGTTRIIRSCCSVVRQFVDKRRTNTPRASETLGIDWCFEDWCGSGDSNPYDIATASPLKLTPMLVDQRMSRPIVVGCPSSWPIEPVGGAVSRKKLHKPLHRDRTSRDGLAGINPGLLICLELLQ